MKTQLLKLKKTVVLSCCILLSLTVSYPENAPNSDYTMLISVPFPDEVSTWYDMNPEIEIVEDTIHFLWASIRSGRGILYYRNSTDGGKTLNPARIIVDTTGNVNTFSGMNDENLRRMSVSGNSVHITYHISSNVFYVRSVDNGNKFSKPVVVASMESTTNRSLSNPYITAVKNRVVIAYTRKWVSSYMGGHLYNDILAVTSTDNGNTFLESAVTGLFDWAYLVDVIQSGNSIHALFVNDKKEKWLGMATSTDQGLNYKITWISDTTTTLANELECFYYKGYLPKIASKGDSLYITWRAIDKDTIPRVFFCSSYNNGISFNKPIVLVDTTTAHFAEIEGYSLTVAAKANHVFVSYNDEDYQAWLMKSVDGGKTFTKPEMMFGNSRLYYYYQNGKLNSKVKFSPADPSGNKVWYVMNNPKYRFSDNAFSTLPPLKIIDLYYSKGYRERTQLAIDKHDVAHFVYEYTGGTSNYDSRFILYRAIQPTIKGADPVNMSLKLHCVDSIGRFDCMHVSSSPDFIFDDAMSIECWVKREKDSDEDQTYVFKQCMTETGSGSFSNGYGLYSDGFVPHAMIYTSDGTYRCYDNDYVLEDEVWAHLAMTYNPSATGYNFKLYMNGNPIDSTKALGKISPWQFESPLWIGGIARTQFAPFNGEIDELRFWNKALTVQEIRQNMRNQLTGKESNLVAYYNFNNTTKDITGRGNDGILLYKEQFVENKVLGNPAIADEFGESQLFQNFPNPFNTSTRISYYLSEQSAVEIRITDLTGHEIKSLKYVTQSAGNHTHELNFGNLQEGVYFYTLIVKNHMNACSMQTKKMMVAK